MRGFETNEKEERKARNDGSSSPPIAPCRFHEELLYGERGKLDVWAYHSRNGGGTTFLRFDHSRKSERND